VTPDLSALFGPPPELSPEQQRLMAEHAERLAQLDLELQRDMIEKTQFFTAILCSCRKHYDPDDATPPSAACYVHGNLLEYDGKVFLR
jgi:hypothetical protein